MSDDFRRPGWNQASLWMGSDLFGLLRIMSRRGFRLPPRSWLDAGIDGAFATGNTATRSLQNLLHGHGIRSVDLPDDPIFILGHWRTGTTLLHELLALDPSLRYATTYECFVPNHFVMTERWMTGWSGFVLPGRRPPDNMLMGWELPQEDEFALCNRGVGSLYDSIAFPNVYPQHLETLELDDLDESRRRRWQSVWFRFLRELLYRKPGRLVLKSPTHSFRVPWLTKWFPQARFVYLVRQPEEVFASTVRLWKSLFATHGYQRRTDWQHPWNLNQFVVDIWQRLHERMLVAVDSLSSDQLITVRYEALAADMAGTVRGIYEAWGMDYRSVEERLQSYQASRAGYQPNQHELTESESKLVSSQLSDYFAVHGYQPRNAGL